MEIFSGESVCQGWKEVDEEGWTLRNDCHCKVYTKIFLVLKG